MKNGILFIGANDMREIDHYVKKYDYGYFIEPIPETYNILEKNLKDCNQNNRTNYIPLNNLITNIDNKVYEFNIYGELHKKRGTKYGNNGASSSIFEKNDKYFWGNCDNKTKIKLKSIRINTLYNQIPNFEKIKTLIIDVQGAELEVLKSFDDKIYNFQYIKTEVSLIPHYKNGVLFPELNKFLNENGFFCSQKPKGHCDLVYLKKREYLIIDKVYLEVFKRQPTKQEIHSGIFFLSNNTIRTFVKLVITKYETELQKMS